MYNQHHAYDAFGNQIGSLKAFGFGNLDPSTFFYVGNVIGLQGKLQDLRTQSNPINDAIITVTGNQVKQANFGCLIATMILGSIFILPLILMCFSCWKKFVNPAYSVPLSTYQKLQSLIFLPTMRQISLTIVDNTFDKTKADCLYNMLSRSSIKGFDLKNLASPNDFNSNEWSDFKENVKLLKSLPILTEIKWQNQVAL